MIIAKQVWGWLTPKHIALVMYMFYLFAGIAFLFYPSNVVKENAQPWSILIWHAFLILGGTISIIGNVKRKLYMEISGTPLVFSSLLVYVVVLISTLGQPGDRGARLGLALLLGASVFGLLGRIKEIVDRAYIETDLNRGGE